MNYTYQKQFTNTHFDAIVIGSGLGGITTATLLAKANKKVLLLEKHYELGGFTHTFKRKNFFWDVGVHYVGQMHDRSTQLKKAFDYLTENQLTWADMGEVYDQAMIENETYYFYSNPETQIAYWIQKFPEEEKGIRAYYALVNSLGANTSMFFGEKSMPYWLSKLIGSLLRKKFNRYSDQTTYQVLKSFIQNEKLIHVLCAQCGNYGLPPKQGSFMMQALITGHYMHGGSYPVGGAAKINETILQNYLNHQGEISLNTEVTEILVDAKHKAYGVQLKNGDVIKANMVISNAGARNTFKHLLKSPNTTTQKIIQQLNTLPASVAHFCLYIGLNKSDAELGLPKHNVWKYNSFQFDEGFNNFIENPNIDIPLAYISFPSAKDPLWHKERPHSATIQVICAAQYEWVKAWEATKWMKRGEEYLALKKDMEQRLLQKVLEVVPQIQDHIVHLELSTPLSTKHFSSHPQGEIYGLAHTPERFRFNDLRVHTPIKNLYLTGQDLISVGVGGALFSGVLTASSILKKNYLADMEKYFKKNKPQS
jgi:all-trans-retinol 13,14-reductase